ncbi:MAG: hypothetical protein ABI444_03455 [Candidatus Kapaibacterium sp.]|jgi:hypothetical protein
MTKTAKLLSCLVIVLLAQSSTGWSQSAIISESVRMKMEAANRTSAFRFPAEYSAQGGANGLVINEIYIGSPNVVLVTDQYVELYNSGTSTVYLDGNVLARFGATGGAVSGGVLTKVAEAWKFPGVPGGKSYKVEPNQFVVMAVNARKVTNGLDLTNANFETFTGIPILDQDNAAVPNLTKLGGGGFIDFTLAAAGDAVVITNGLDTNIIDGIDLATVIDGVQFSTTATTGLFPSTIDASVSGGKALVKGLALERKVKGVTTYSSHVDFDTAAPSPGYQHGSAPVIGQTKASDLFPLDLGKYVQYDQYATDSNSNKDLTTKSYSSSTIVAIGRTVGAVKGVATQRDTSGKTQTAPGTMADVDYVADAKGDIKVYADANFLSLFVPPALGAVITPPDSFVSYLALSNGFGATYPIIAITQNVTYSGTAATINLTTNGVFQGIESVTVPAGTFDSAYRFTITANVKVSVSILTVANLSIPLQIWLVKGVGIVKSSSPAATGSPIPFPGSEREMTGHGTTIVSAVRAASGAVRSPILLSPNPASGFVHLNLGSLQVAGSVTLDLFDDLGRRVEQIFSGSASDLPNFALDTRKLAEGTYFVNVKFVGESGMHDNMLKLVVTH